MVLVSDHLGLTSDSESVLDSTLHSSYNKIREERRAITYYSPQSCGTIMFTYATGVD